MPILEDIFEVDCYAFQICTFDLFSNGLDIPKEVIYKTTAEEFTTRMYWYDLDKVTIKELEKFNSEYLIIDLHSIIGKVIKVNFHNNSVYTQSSMSRLLSFFESIKKDNITELQALTFEEIPLKNFDKEIIKNGLKQFASWINNHFEKNKVIVYIPKLARKYTTINNEILEYDEIKLKQADTLDNITKEFSEVIIENVPGCILLNDIENKIAQFAIYDNLQGTPPQTHYSLYDNFKQSEELLKLLKIEPLNGVNYYTSKLLIQQKNHVLKQNQKYKDFQYNIVTLNNYFNKISNLKDVIICISAMDESSRMLKYFRNKSILGVEFFIKYRESFIAIVDKYRNFIYECSMTNKISYDYTVENNNIHIESAGFLAGNESIISINNQENLSKKKRGLNIVLLNSKTFELIDTAYVDTYEDKELKVISDYFNNIKIKI